jgi:hypothetical protein
MVHEFSLLFTASLLLSPISMPSRNLPTGLLLFAASLVVGSVFSQTAKKAEEKADNSICGCQKHVVVEKGKLANKRAIIVGDGARLMLVDNTDILLM